MVSAPSRGSHQMANNCPVPGSSPSWLRATALFGSVRKGLASWKDGKLTGYPDVGQAVSSLLQDVEGTLWFGVRDPGRLCAVRAGKTQCYGKASSGWSVSALYEDHKGNLWASAQTGLWRWAPGPPNQFQWPDRAVEAKALIEDDKGALLMATGRSGPLASSVTGVIDGLKQLVGGKILSYPLPGTAGQFRPTCLFRSSDGSLWVGTVEGLLHLHQGRIDRFSVTEGLSGNFIRSIFEDREGSVWVSTEDGSIDFVNWRCRQFRRTRGGAQLLQLRCCKRLRTEVSGFSRPTG